MRRTFRSLHGLGRTLVSCTLALGLPTAAWAQDDHPIWGTLEPGSHSVGFTVEYTRDASRAERREVRPDGSVETLPTHRMMQVAFWYPAAPGDGGGDWMSLGDYIDLQEFGLIDDDERYRAELTQAQRREVRRAWPTYGIMSGVAMESWEDLLETRMRARASAQPLSGPFPLVVLMMGASGSVADVIGTAEYLASHGFVVAGAPSRGQDDYVTRDWSDARLTEEIIRDAEYVIARAAERPFVSIDDLGIVGFSRGGSAALLLGMRNPTIDAVVTFDSGLGTTVTQSPWYDPTRLTAPLLAFRAGSEATRYPPLEELPYSTMIVAAVPGFHHVDFTALGMIHTALGVRNQYITLPDDVLRAKHAEVTRLTRLFLRAHVTRDTNAARELATASVDGLTLAAYPGRAAPPSSGYLTELLWRPGGVAQVAGLVRAERATNPNWLPFREVLLRATANRFVELGRTPEAIGAVRLNLELYPQAFRSHALLGDLLLSTGDRRGALASYEQTLALNPDHEVAATRVAELRAELE